MGIFKNHRVQEEEQGGDDTVVIRRPENRDGGEPYVVTVNCPDKTGLGCDLCRVILFFGLSIVRGDVTTEGRWCYIVFWVVGNGETRWGLLKRRLREACPPVPSIRTSWFAQVEQPRPPQIFLLKFWCSDRLGLLHDVTKVLHELELIIRNVKVSTTPEGKVVDLFFLTDVRELLHTDERREDVSNHLKSTLKDPTMECEIELADEEMNTYIQAPSFLPSTAMEEFFDADLPKVPLAGSLQRFNKVSVAVDNSITRSHTIIHIFCWDHKGLVYDIMRTMKDYHIQISYGRFNTKKNGGCDIELFVTHADGNKLTDATKQAALLSRLRWELSKPLLVTIENRGPDLELLVANPVEVSGKGRPLVFHDITCALKELNLCIFSAEIGRHVICDREWEVYRVLLSDDCASFPTASIIEAGVKKKLMGWD